MMGGKKWFRDLGFRDWGLGLGVWGLFSSVWGLGAIIGFGVATTNVRAW